MNWGKLEQARVAGDVIGYTFHAGDLFHYGHLRQLEQSSEHCDYLVVGVLTDQAIASYKRLPIIPYPYRAAVYAALKCVDDVIAQDSRDTTENLKNIRPHVLFHGSDWPEVPGAEWMKGSGGKLVVTRYFHGLSTTDIIRRLRAALLVEMGHKTAHG